MRILSVNGVETTGYHMGEKKKEPRHRPYILHKKWLKTDHRSKWEMLNYKTSKR